ncbi:hypothetical protein D3C86_1066130 [compost metagenome]
MPSNQTVPVLLRKMGMSFDEVQVLTKVWVTLIRVQPKVPTGAGQELMMSGTESGPVGR